MAEVDWPLLRREKASLVPSGDQVGCQSVAVVNPRPLVPSALMTWMPPFGQTANAISLMRSVGGGGGPDAFTTMSPLIRFLSVSTPLTGLPSGILAQKFCAVPRPSAPSGSARLSWSGTAPSGGPLSTARHPSACPIAVVSLAPATTPAIQAAFPPTMVKQVTRPNTRTPVAG